MSVDIDQYHKKVDDLLKTHYLKSKADENLLRIGIKLGRLLEKHDIADIRLPYFIELDKAENNRKEIKSNLKEIEKILFDIFIKAQKEQIRIHGPLYFDCNEWNMEDAKFETTVASKYHMQHVDTVIDKLCGSVELTYEITGKLGDIFISKNIEPKFIVSLYCGTEGEIDVINEEDEVENSFFLLNISLNNFDNLSIIEFKELKDEFLKFYTFFALSLT